MSRNLTFKSGFGFILIESSFPVATPQLFTCNGLDDPPDTNSPDNSFDYASRHSKKILSNVKINVLSEYFNIHYVS